MCPRLLERTRLVRLVATPQDWTDDFWTDDFLAAPTVWGVADRYGSEVRHPWREKRGNPARRIGRTGAVHPVKSRLIS